MQAATVRVVLVLCVGAALSSAKDLREALCDDSDSVAVFLAMDAALWEPESEQEEKTAFDLALRLATSARMQADYRWGSVVWGGSQSSTRFPIYTTSYFVREHRLDQWLDNVGPVISDAAIRSFTGPSQWNIALEAYQDFLMSPQHAAPSQSWFLMFVNLATSPPLDAPRWQSTMATLETATNMSVAVIGLGANDQTASTAEITAYVGDALVTVLHARSSLASIVTSATWPDILLDALGCDHGASCTSCPPGTYGASCQHACRGATICNGAGTRCGDASPLGVCQCDPGFTGADCVPEDAACRSPDLCSGHGSVCDDTGQVQSVCRCDDGYRGDQCDQQCRSGTICSGHGTLCDPDGDPADVPGTVCYCDPGYLAIDCAVPCRGPSVCSGHGTLCDADAPAQCVCDDPFYGANCQFRPSFDGTCGLQRLR